MRTLREFATKRVDEMSQDLGPPNDRPQAIERWMRMLVATGSVPDDILEAMPEVSRHNEPQESPQEWECGCVAMTRVTDRDYRHHEKPFEMRLAIRCDGRACEMVLPS